MVAANLTLASSGLAAPVGVSFGGAGFLIFYYIGAHLLMRCIPASVACVSCTVTPLRMACLCRRGGGAEQIGCAQPSLTSSGCFIWSAYYHESVQRTEPSVITGRG